MDLKLISWKCCKVLLAVTTWLYFIGLRYLLMTTGIYAFLRVDPCINRIRVKILHSIANLLCSLFASILYNSLLVQICHNLFQKWLEKWTRLKAFITDFKKYDANLTPCNESIAPAVLIPTLNGEVKE